MAKIVKFKPRHGRRPHGRQHRFDRRKKARPAWQFAVVGVILGAILGGALVLWPTPDPSKIDPIALFTASDAKAESPNTRAGGERFSFCHTGGGFNCVVDGDTIWMDGVKIRVADIDAPETHPPRCPLEADLGNRATRRLLELVNEGPFEASPIGERDQDRYGRQLRVLIRNGQSLGDILVSEGLARTWDGARHPWC